MAAIGAQMRQPAATAFGLVNDLEVLPGTEGVLSIADNNMQSPAGRSIFPSGDKGIIGSDHARPCSASSLSGFDVHVRAGVSEFRRTFWSTVTRAGLGADGWEAMNCEFS
ncbi:hypothetical protein ACE103_08400 [Bradyrhizobium sp. ma5]|uniref:hypothetical protein n=1 Tax=Bradyrhizobium sp. ma5 TaxID=3344828 RepID=UPI0035D483E5